MGNKTNPRLLRLNITDTWDCVWYAEGQYSENVLQDFMIRNHLKTVFKRAGVSRIRIRRRIGRVMVEVFVGRSGFVFGRKGMDLAMVKEEVTSFLPKKTLLTLKVLDQQNPEANSRLIGEWIASQLERRIPFRRAMKMAIQKAQKAGVEGIKVTCGGRLAGSEIARTESYLEGKVPLHTFRADIDYSFTEALTTYGKIGIKVWVYNGEVKKRYTLVDDIPSS